MPGLPEYVRVRGSEEESDVHLPTRLPVDCFNDQYEKAVVVSDDAGLASAMRYVRNDPGLRVAQGYSYPGNTGPGDPWDAANAGRRIWKRHLGRSQFSETLADEHGTIRMTQGW